MRKLVLLALVGFLAQLVDGALGMAYGVTSTTLLLFIGLSPASASASVHLAEVGTTLASGVSHWKLGNVSWRAVGWMAVPGGIGAFIGATALSNFDGDAAKSWTSAILFTLGGYVLLRFLFMRERAVVDENTPPVKRRFLIPLGLFAGTLDAIGGGGWGPVATPTLLASGRMKPREVIGTVDSSEFLVSLGASIGFLLALSREQILWPIVGALLIGGLFAAPIAAYLVRILHPRLLGVAVGGLILLTNARTLASTFDFTPTLTWLVYAVLIALWIGAIAFSANAVRKAGDRVLGGAH